MGGGDDETRIAPPEPDATQMMPSGADSPTVLGTPSPSQSSNSHDETILSGGSHSSGVTRPIAQRLSSPRGATSMPGAKRIGDYEIESEIARGGMGIVYKARQLSLNRPVAFKMILAGQFASTADVERFHVEAEAAAGLDHPNIVSIYEVGAFEGNHFFTMKYIDGRSMAQEMPRLVAAPRDGVRLLVKVCRAIHYAHQHSILHRDLKPANILLDANGEPHVTDFGLAKRTEGDSQLTQTGAIVGTPSYMSPEQAKPSSTPLTTSADVYSLGAILYEILTGRPPFKGASPLDTLLLVLNKDAERPSGVKAGADRDLETIALKCLEKDPVRRYGSAEALAEDLDRWLNHEPILARPIGTVERIAKWARRRPAIAALAATMAIITILGVAGVVWQWREAVHQRELTAGAMRQVAQEAKAAEEARDQEAAQRKTAEAAQNQETIARKAADEQRTVAVNALAAAEQSAYFNNISLADHELASNNIGHVDQLLATAPPAVRGWEWHYMNRLAHMESASIGFPAGSIRAVAIDAGGIATVVSSDLQATLVDLQSHRAVRTVKLNSRPGMDLNALSLSPDGRRFAAVMMGVEKGTLQFETGVWDTRTGARLMTQTAQQLFTYTAMALTPDGTRLFTASIDSTPATGGAAPSGASNPAEMIAMLSAVNSRIQVWDTSSGSELPGPGRVAGRISSLRLSVDGRLVAAGASGVTEATDVQIIDATTGKVVGRLNKSGEAPVVFSHDGHYVLRGSSAGVSLWPAAGGDELWSWKGDATSAVAFSPDDHTIAAALSDRSIQIFDAANGNVRGHLVGNTAPVTMLRFGSASSIIAADADHLRTFAMPTTASAVVGTGPADAIFTLGVTPDRRRLVTIARGALRAWDLQTGEVLYGLPAEPGNQSATTSLPAEVASAMAVAGGQLAGVDNLLLFSADGRRTVLRKSMLTMVDGRMQPRIGLRVMDTTTGREVAALDPAPNDGRASAAPGAGTTGAIGTTVAMGLSLDSTGTRAALAVMKASRTAPRGRGSGMSVEGSYIALWSTTRKEPVRMIALPDQITGEVVMSGDGRYVAVTSAAFADTHQASAAYRVYESATGRLVATFPGDREKAPIVFTRDSRLMAAETARHTVTIWPLDGSRKPLVLPEHRLNVTRIAFSPDATRLATLSDQKVTVFDTESGNQLLVLRESGGPVTQREFIIPGKIAAAVSTLEFSADGHQIVRTSIANDPKGIKLTVTTWDGSPAAKR